MNIAILISGEGSNMRAIVEQYLSAKLFNMVDNISVFCNNSKSFKNNRDWCYENGIDCYYVIDHDLINALKILNINFIILAGYLSILKGEILDIYKNKIVNIHPSLLPKYGGKGMYGIKVHEEVIKNCEEFTGITTHYVTEEIDGGEIIQQIKIPVLKTDNPISLQQRIKKIENKLYPVLLHIILEGLK